jgi:hypothetical protein
VQFLNVRKKELPDDFEILLDSWDAQNGSRLTAVFASFILQRETAVGTQRKKMLLFVTPMLDESDFN